MKLSKKTLEQIKTKMDKLIANGETKDHAISIICDRNNLNPQDVKNQLGVTSEKKPSKYKDIKNSEGSYVMLKKNPQKQYEVININNKDTIVLRDLDNNSEIKVSEDEIIPVVTETKMSENLNEAQYTVSIDNLETTDAETLSQMLSLAGQAEEPAMGDVPPMDEPVVEPTIEELPPMEEPVAEVPPMEPEDVTVPVADEELPPEVGAPEIDDSFGMEEYEQYPVEESCCSGKKDVEESVDEEKPLSDEEIEEVKNFFFDIAADKEQYPETEDMVEAMRSLNTEGMISSEQYDYCTEHWDEWIQEADKEEEEFQPKVEEKDKPMLTEEEPVVDNVKKQAAELAWLMDDANEVTIIFDALSDEEKAKWIADKRAKGYEGESDYDVLANVTDEDNDAGSYMLDYMSPETMKKFVEQNKSWLEDDDAPLSEEQIDEQIKESLRMAGIELDEASGDAQMGVRDEPVVATKPKADPTDKKQDDKEPGENQRPETSAHEIEDIMGAEGSQQGRPCDCNIHVCEMVSKDKIEAICETARKMYAKKDQKEWLALDRRYVEKLIREGVCYSNASKMLLKAKAGK